MNPLAFIWSDPRFVYAIAAVAVVLLFVTIWLFRRPKRTGRQAGIVCLMLSILAHLALLLLVPMLASPNGGSSTAKPDEDENIGVDAVTFSAFDEALIMSESAGDEPSATVAPLPVADVSDLLAEPMTSDLLPPNVEVRAEEVEPSEEPVPESLAENLSDDLVDELDTALAEAMDSEFALPQESLAIAQLDPPAVDDSPLLPDMGTRVGDVDPTFEAKPVAMKEAPPGLVVGDKKSDFANRVGSAKDLALHQTGGNDDTEAAVNAALQYIADHQSEDGSWDPATTGAGVERSPLGENRGGAGRNAKTAISGLALLALLGSGNTHQNGPYADNVYRGLAYLIRNQKSDGSLAGNSTIYASTYCHGMASLAMCEAAAITRDPSAITAAKRAIAFTKRMQHPATGGWRYTPGDPGDMSQLGWQAMVLDAGHRAKLPIDRSAVAGVQRFLRSVRTGRTGGLASYRPGEAPSRTMTAEALATRLLVGDQVPQGEIDEAENYILQQLPGNGQDNYYYWYYASLALHQLQDNAWETWNDSLQSRLLTTQATDGSWPTSSVWGGYGGKIYTTAMAALCLESYYRHTLRSDRERIANLDNPLRIE